jgi:hypothetical protein
MQFYDRLYDYVKDRDLSWFRYPGPKTEDTLLLPFYPGHDWQFRKVQDETGWMTLTQDGKAYLRVNWLDDDDAWILADEVNTPVYLRLVWDDKKNVYRSDGTYYDSESSARGTGERKRKAKVEPLVTMDDADMVNE